MEFDALKERLAPLVFRLQWRRLRNQEYGTGFFISPTGLALTAYHNLAAALEDAGEPIAAEWQGTPIELFWKLPSPQDEGWQRSLDVAILEARPPIHIEAPVCALAYLDASWSRQERAQYWKGRPAVLMGYHGERREEARLIAGSISADEPIVDPVVEDRNCHPAGRAAEALNLGVDFQQNGRDTIRGVSGAPLVDQHTGEIVGVQFAALPDRERAIAREFHHVVKAWTELGGMARAIPKPAPPVAANRRIPSLPLIGIVCLALVLGWILWRSAPWAPMSPAAQILDARPGKATLVPEYVTVETAAPARQQKDILGVTLWRLRPSVPSDAANIRLPVHDEAGRPSAWTPVRVPSGYRFADGDYVRLGIESPRAGYLYVVDRERRSDGTLSAPTLIFPTLRVRGGDNRVFAGRLTEIPGESDTPPYLTLRLAGPGHTGEQLSIVIAPQPLPGVQVQRDYQVIGEAQFAAWQRWRVAATRLELKDGAGRPWTPAERAAGREGERALRQEEAAPQTLYRVAAAAEHTFLIEIPLEVRRPGAPR